MKTTMSVGQIIEASLVFSNPRYADQEMDMSISMWVMRNGKACGEVHKMFEDKRIALFEEIAIKDKDEKKAIPDEKMPEYKETLEKLFEEEVEIEISMMAVQALDALKITPMDLRAIMFTISE